MIENTNLISDIDGYKKFNHFEISDNLKVILSDDYNKFDKDSNTKQVFVNDLYKKNFEEKYDREENKDIFKLYIDNKQFKDKAQFIYSVVDYDKYAQFVAENPNLDNPGDLTIKYSILDSDGVKVQIYYISIIDISFVF